MHCGSERNRICGNQREQERKREESIRTSRLESRYFDGARMLVDKMSISYFVFFLPLMFSFSDQRFFLLSFLHSLSGSSHGMWHFWISFFLSHLICPRCHLVNNRLIPKWTKNQRLLSSIVQSISFYVCVLKATTSTTTRAIKEIGCD